jgi:hypothetical protein
MKSIMDYIYSIVLEVIAPNKTATNNLGCAFFVFLENLCRLKPDIFDQLFIQRIMIRIKLEEARQIKGSLVEQK